MHGLSCKTVFAAVLGGVLLLTGNGASAETLRLAGTGGAMAMVDRIAAEFDVATGIKIQIIPGLGSKGAISAAADGAVDLVVSARLPNPDEAGLGLTASPIARTALVLVTSHRKPNSLNSTELPGIYSAANPKWADGSPVHIILRTRFDGDSIILAQRFRGMSEAMEVARQRQEIPVAATDQDSADLAEHLAGSFVQAGLSQIKTEKRDLRFVPIDGVEPTLENFESGKYPYEKIFYLLYRTNMRATAERLVDFIRSAKGRSILRETGNLPAGE
jgi:phosphate transport system substrate-binding protein